MLNQLHPFVYINMKMLSDRVADPSQARGRFERVILYVASESFYRSSRHYRRVHSAANLSFFGGNCVDVNQAPIRCPGSPFVTIELGKVR